ncbi:MAG: hypothetical protein EU536_01815 [Promethearchaeota archaeon]|nr:MAG: hypothetical protein EU536_01815 [Candidatus Lokiarchaeota archaeon]
MKVKDVTIDPATGKITFTFEGNPTVEEIKQFYLQFQNDSPSSPTKKEPEAPMQHDHDSTIRDKLELIVKEIKHGWFTSEHIRELYLHDFQEEIKPSTVSTYLARMFNEGILERRGSRARREYHVSEKPLTHVAFVD